MLALYLYIGYIAYILIQTAIEQNYKFKELEDDDRN